MTSDRPLIDKPTIEPVTELAGKRSPFGNRWGIWGAVGTIVAAGTAVYWNSFAGVYVFDDIESIVTNTTIRQWWRLDRVLCPPHTIGETVGNRPLLNLSFAVNYAISGTEIWSYHLVNLLLHLANALLLFDLLRRTFERPGLPRSVQHRALWLALVIAGLWTVHPLQTEAVTYIVERAESLVALFYLLTLYCVLRSVDSNRPDWWRAGTVVACVLGMATKEIMVTAPVMVLIYDRTFLAGSFGEAWRRRWGMYVAMAATWLLLIGLILSTGHVFRGAEFAVPPRSQYLLTQPQVILYYLRLAVWPYPQCAYYAWPVSESWREILPALTIVMACGLVSLWALARRPMWGFLGMWFFGILAPTSSVAPLRDVIVERRMYLPLAAVLALLVSACFAVGRVMVRRGWLPERTAGGLGLCLVMLLAATWGLLTIQRNRVYSSEFAIWEDTVEKAPHNTRAQNNLGMELARCGQFAEAIEHYEKAIRLNPGHFLAHNNLGNALARLGRPAEAIEHYQEAIRLKPDYANAYDNLGNVLVGLGRLAEAIEHHQEAVRLQPDDSVAHSNLGLALAQTGRLAEAVEHYQEAIRLKADYAPAHYNLGNALFELRRTAEALKHYDKAVTIDPNYADARNNLASVLAQSGRLNEAIGQYQEAVRLNPKLLDARYNLARALSQVGRLREAVQQGREAIRLAPNQADVYRFLAWLIATHEVDKALDPAEAVKLAEQACTLAGRRDLVCLDTLAAAYASAGRFAEAESTAKEAWQLAQAAGQDSLAEELHIRLQLYRNRKPFRELVGGAAKGRP